MSGYVKWMAFPVRNTKLLSGKVKRSMQEGVASTIRSIAPFGLVGDEFRVSYRPDSLPRNGFRQDAILSVAIGWHAYEARQPVTPINLQRGLPRHHAHTEEDCRCVTQPLPL